MKRLLLVILFCLIMPTTIFASIYHQSGVESNILVINNRVYFIQSDNSWTVLNIDNGEVIMRKTQPTGLSYGKLIATPDGILVLGYSFTTLLDANTLEIKRQNTS